MIKKTQTINTVEKGKNGTIGTPSHAAQTFKKSDFLTKRALAAKFHESQELVEKTIKKHAITQGIFHCKRSPIPSCYGQIL